MPTAPSPTSPRWRHRGTSTANAPTINQTSNPNNSPSSSPNSPISPASRCVLPNTSPPTKAATKPLASNSSAAKYEARARVGTKIATDVVVVHRSATCQAQQPSTAEPDRHASKPSHRQVGKRGRRSEVDTSCFGDRSGEEEHHERRRQAVVQSTLDIERAPDSNRHTRIGHDRCAERGVGRRQGRGGDGAEPGIEVGQEHGRNEAQPDRQRKPDQQQPGWEPGIGPQRAQVRPARRRRTARARAPAR